MDELIRRFTMHFTVTAEKAERYYDNGYDELIADLNDGTSVMYDDWEQTMRTIPRNPDKLTTTQFRKEFGRRLIKLMMFRGMTQSVLAERVGVTQAAVSKWLTGKATPNFEVIDKIARVLNCSTEDFRYKK